MDVKAIESSSDQKQKSSASTRVLASMRSVRSQLGGGARIDLAGNTEAA
jgi:hypothetical protein